MPAEETTPQVAPASDPADSGAAQEGQALVSQETAAGANSETTPEPDIKAALEKAKAEVAQEWSSKLAAAEKRAADAENLVRTQAGTQSASDRRLNRLEQQIQRQGDILKAGLTTPDASAEITRLENAHRSEDQTSFSSFEAEQRQSIVAALKVNGFTEDDVNHEELADARNLWDVGHSLADSRRIEAAVQSVARGIKRMQAAKQAEKPSAASVKTEPTPGAVPNGTGRRIPNMSTGEGVSVGAISMSALVAKYGEDYDSLTSAQRKSAEDYMKQEGLI